MLNKISANLLTYTFKNNEEIEMYREGRKWVVYHIQNDEWFTFNSFQAVMEEVTAYEATLVDTRTQEKMMELAVSNQQLQERVINAEENANYYRKQYEALTAAFNDIMSVAMGK